MDRRRATAPRPSLLSLLLTPLLLLQAASPAQATGGVVSIRDELPFKALRECAADCLVWNSSGDLIGKLGCKYPYQNDCLCRADLGGVATKHLSSCGTTRCTVGPPDGDISSALSIYNSYCLANGYEVTKAQAQAAPTGTGGMCIPRSRLPPSEQWSLTVPIYSLLWLRQHGGCRLAAECEPAGGDGRLVIGQLR